MNWKLLFAIIFLAIIGFVATRFFLSGQPWTLDGLTTYVQTGTRNTIDSAMIFLAEKWQLVVTVVGAGTTAIAGLYKAIQSKIAGIRQVAETQVDTAQSQVTQQYENMKVTVSGLEKTIDTRNATIIDLQSQLTTLQNQSTSVQQIKDQYVQLEGAMKNVQGTNDYLQGQLEKKIVELEQYKPKPIP
jgi:hypothetical protein